MKSNTRIEKQLQKKTNSELVETIIAAKKNKGWAKVASALSSSRRIRLAVNLEEISKMAKDNETVIIPGKVLSQGNLDKKVKVVALNFSQKAKEKLLNSKNETTSILEEIKKNPEGKGIVVLKR